MNNKITWFKLMWMNWYIQLFGVAIGFLGLLIYLFKDEGYNNLRFWLGLSIPIGMMFLIGYYGFYKYWKEIKKYL